MAGRQYWCVGMYVSYICEGERERKRKNMFVKPRMKFGEGRDFYPIVNYFKIVCLMYFRFYDLTFKKFVSYLALLFLLWLSCSQFSGCKKAS